MNARRNTGSETPHIFTDHVIPALLGVGPQFGPLSSSVGGGNLLYAMLQFGYCKGHNGVLCENS